MLAHSKKIRFDLHDVAMALFQYQGIHVGRWHLAIDLSVKRAEVGPSDQGALPGVVVVVAGLELERRDDAPPGTSQIFDAAKENPAAAPRS